MNQGALNFVSGEGNTELVGKDDSDLFSWLLMNSDLMPITSNSPMRKPLENPGGSLLPDSLNLEDTTNTMNPLIINSDDSGVSREADKKTDNKRKKSSDLKPKTENKKQKVTNTATTSSKDIKNLTAQEKRKRRLEKNREIARNCRKRKKERIQALEEEVVRLREWNFQLEKKLNTNENGVDREDIRLKEMNEIVEMVNTGKASQELKKKLASYKDVYADFGKQRKEGMQFHLDQLKSLLLPNQVSKMTLWSLQQDDEFYDEQKNQNTFGGGIWNLLCEELELTDEQKKQLVEMRHPIRAQRKNLGECLKILAELEQRVGENFESMASQMSKLMGTISAKQQAKFLIWIEKNQSCMMVLSQLYQQQNEQQLGTIKQEDTTTTTTT